MDICCWHGETYVHVEGGKENDRKNVSTPTRGLKNLHFDTGAIVRALGFDGVRSVCAATATLVHLRTSSFMISLFGLDWPKPTLLRFVCVPREPPTPALGIDWFGGIYC